jgi:hypothetical protein
MGMICETTGDKLNNVSPLNVDVKKSNGKQRSNSMPCLLIHLCLFVPLNALSFLKEGREIFGQSRWGFVLDISRAFYHIEIHPEHYSVSQIVWNGKYYY